MAAFDDLVLAWLRDPEGGRHPEATRIIEVKGRGSDWNGSTEGGFYSVFAVDVRWADDAAGREVYDWFDGEQMESLWHHVVRSWPT